MKVVRFGDFPEDEREGFYRVCKALGQDPKDFHISAEETVEPAPIPRQRVILIVDKRDANPIRINRGIIQADWVDAFERAFKARMTR
jgi:hypothetical protein